MARLEGRIPAGRAEPVRPANGQNRATAAAGEQFAARLRIAQGGGKPQGRIAGPGLSDARDPATDPQGLIPWPLMAPPGPGETDGKPRSGAVPGSQDPAGIEPGNGDLARLLAARIREVGAAPPPPAGDPPAELEARIGGHGHPVAATLHLIRTADGRILVRIRPSAGQQIDGPMLARALRRQGIALLRLEVEPG